MSAHTGQRVVITAAAAGIGRVVVEAFVAAGAVVPNDVTVPSRALARGVPATIVADAAPQDVIAESVTTYVRNSHWYRKELRRLD